MKDSFIFYTEYKEVIRFMSDDQAGALLKALIEYAEGASPVINDPSVNMVFLTIKPRMDRDREKWEKECERRAAAGRLGGLAKASKAKQRQAKASEAKERLAIQADSDTDSDTEYNISPPIPPRKTQKVILKEAIASSESSTGSKITQKVRRCIEAWIEYKSERNERYKPAGMKALVNKAVKNADQYGEDRLVDAVSYSMSSGYKGIVWDQCARSRRASSFNNAPPRDYDMKEIEKMLLRTN